MAEILYSLISVHGLQDCYAHQEQCKDSRNLLEAYHCHLKGKFPHPTNANVYLLCPDVGYKACLCNCDYEEMCFDITKGSCKFEFLGDIGDCTRPLPISAYSKSYTKIQSTDYTSDDPNIVQINTNRTSSVNESVQSVEKDNTEEQNQLYISNNTVRNVNFTVHIWAPKSNTDKGKQEPGVQRTTSSSTQESANVPSSITLNKSGFPAWMFTLVILCLIILIVLILLYIRW